MTNNNIDMSDVEELEIVEEIGKHDFTRRVNNRIHSGYFLIGEPKVVVNDGMITYIQILGKGSKKKRKERVLDYE